ncbi:MAG TPA: pectate lyase [Sphingobacterium sp.]|jgi:PelA/Pel-15E family pectate lyase|nr:pectate lyase [Sphingobacterium sp.]
MKIRRTLFGIGLALMACHMMQAQSAAKDSLAEKLLIYQLPNGAWPKQLADKRAVNYSVPLTEDLLKKIEQTDNRYATIDNEATTREIHVLVKAFTETGNSVYREAAKRGVLYLLEAQYDNGGFPQYYPNKSLYRAEITYNDNAMINALVVLDKVAYGKDGFEIFDDNVLQTKAKEAVAKGVGCILKTQVKQADSLSIWAAQYDENTLQPAQARKFEPASLSTAESVGIVRFLMEQPADPAIERAVDAAVAWFKSNDIEGYRFDRTVDKKTGKLVRELVPDSSSVVWARFYDIKNNKPLFGDRDNSVTYNFDEISDERKNGYAWFGNWPQKLLDREYPKWKKKIKAEEK